MLFRSTSSSTGTLKVTAGTLTLSGKWANCTNLVAAGGTFAVKNANAFGDGDRGPGERPTLTVNVTSGATLNLDYTGRIDCKEFRLDGVKLYGSVSATDLLAAIEADRGVKLERSQLDLPDQLKEVGDYKATLDLGEGVKAPFSVKIVEESAQA